MKAFITGSKAYKNDKEGSDVDLVIFTDSQTGKQLEHLGDNQTHPIRFGNLNLILTYDEIEYAAWLEATRRCKMEALLNPAKFSKEKAIEIHEEMRRILGISYDTASG